MDLAGFAELGNINSVEFQVFGPVLIGIGTAESKDDELVTVGNRDETWRTRQKRVSFLSWRSLPWSSKVAMSFHSDAVIYSPFSTSGQLPAGTLGQLLPEHFNRSPVELVLPGQYEAAANWEKK